MLPDLNTIESSTVYFTKRRIKVFFHSRRETLVNVQLSISHIIFWLNFHGNQVDASNSRL